MTYHYRVDTPVMVPDGPDDFTIEIDSREFSRMSCAKLYAAKWGGEVVLVMSDGQEVVLS